MERVLKNMLKATEGRFGRIARVVISIALVTWLVTHIGIDEIVHTTSGADIGWLALAILALVPAVMLRSLTLQVLTNKDGWLLSFRQAGAITLVGMSSALFLPPGVADLARAHIAYRALGKPERIVSASMLERMISLLGLLVLGAVASLLANEPLLASASAGAALVMLTLITFPRLIPWRWVVKFLSAGAELDAPQLMAATRVPRAILLTALASTTLGWVASATITYFVCLSLGIELGFAFVALATILTAISRLLPVSAAGIGVGELTLSYLLIRGGTTPEQAAGVALLTLVFGLILPGLIGLFVTVSASENERTQHHTAQGLTPTPVYAKATVTPDSSPREVPGA